MATDLVLTVSGSVFGPGLVYGTGSVGPITASQLGANLRLLQSISASYSGTFASTGSVGAITASQLGANSYPTSLVNFQQPSTGSVITGSSGTVFYVLTGWYALGGSRETWGGTSVNTPPPSGHTLLDIIVMGSYPPQNSAT